jgi:hypothetical protein
MSASLLQLQYSYRKATSLIDRMNTTDRSELKDLCCQIRQAEEELNVKANDFLCFCRSSCKGSCCRKMLIDAVIGVSDFVYILVEAAELRDTISQCLEREEAFNTPKCPFLKDDVGPCQFPDPLRPKVCLTSFCQSDAVVRAAIRHVNKCFRKIGRFIFLKGWREGLWLGI